MALTDLFTGRPAINAAQNARNLYGNTENRILNIADLTRGVSDGYVRQGYGDARQDLGTGFVTANDAVNRGAGNAQGYLDQGATGALGALAGARGDLTAGGGAYAPLSALAGRYGQGAGLYADALGVNGAGGVGRARDAYTTGLGYESQLNAGIDAINRKRNAAGSLVGGNADRDAQIFGQDLAKQDYGSWLDRLGGFNNLELSATSGAAAGNQANNQAVANLGVAGANIRNQQGINQAGVATGQGNSLADIANRYYGGQAVLDTGEAGALTNNINTGSNMVVNAIDRNAGRTAQTFQDEAQASLTGQKNLLNLGMQGAQTLAGMGGIPGLGGMAGFSGSAITGANPYNPFGNTLPFGGPR